MLPKDSNGLLISHTELRFANRVVPECTARPHATPSASRRYPHCLVFGRWLLFKFVWLWWKFSIFRSEFSFLWSPAMSLSTKLNFVAQDTWVAVRYCDNYTEVVKLSKVKHFNPQHNGDIHEGKLFKIKTTKWNQEGKEEVYFGIVEAVGGEYQIYFPQISSKIPTHWTFCLFQCPWKVQKLHGKLI